MAGVGWLAAVRQAGFERVDGCPACAATDESDSFFLILPHSRVGSATVLPNAPAKIAKEACETIITSQSALPIRFEERAHRVERREFIKSRRKFAGPTIISHLGNLTCSPNVCNWALPAIRVPYSRNAGMTVAERRRYS